MEQLVGEQQPGVLHGMRPVRGRTEDTVRAFVGVQTWMAAVSVVKIQYRFDEHYLVVGPRLQQHLGRLRV